MDICWYYQNKKVL